MRKKDGFILGSILFVALLLRLYHINAPLADFHSWRQADTAAVARNFETKGFDLLKPTYDDYSNIQSGVDNPKGYRFVEFPIYNALFAGLHSALPFVSLETWGRLVSIFFSLACIAALYYLALVEVGRIPAIFSAISFAIMPFFVYFSRTILPDNAAVSLAIGSIFFLHLFTTSSNKRRKIVWFFLSSFIFALALLIKPTAAFYGIPLLFLFVRKYKFTTPRQLHILLFFFIAVSPLLLWRYYITQFPEGIPASSWLFTQVNTFEGEKDIFMRPAFFRWIFYERINNLILGGYLTFFFVLGFIRKQKSFLPFVITTSSILYIFVFQGGNVQHEYYQIMAFPGIVLAIGLGASTLFEHKSIFIHTYLITPIIVGLFGISFLFSWFQVKGYYNIPQDLLLMSKIIQTFSKSNDLVVADRMGDTTLLYLSNRKGSPIFNKEPEEFKRLGYSYILTDKSEIVLKLKEGNYSVLFENDQFALFAL